MLRSELKLAGVIGLSTYLSLRTEEPLGDANKGTPVLLAHGTGDQVVRPLVAAPHLSSVPRVHLEEAIRMLKG